MLLDLPAAHGASTPDLLEERLTPPRVVHLEMQQKATGFERHHRCAGRFGDRGEGVDRINLGNFAMACALFAASAWVLAADPIESRLVHFAKGASSATLKGTLRGTAASRSYPSALRVDNARRASPP